MKEPPTSLRAFSIALGATLLAAACSTSDGAAGGAPPGPSGPPPTPAGTPCADDSACTGGHCLPNGCLPDPTPDGGSTAIGTDGVKDGDETDVDCGGTAAPPCADGRSCLAPSDCATKVCIANVCSEPSPTDGVKDGDESDIDCGGASAPKCADGKACLAPGDCASKVCTANVCIAPTPTDGVQNGDETDVDCGGASAPKCVAAKHCIQHADCVKDACRDGVCAEARSCRQKYGGATCGAGEVGDPAAVHEDCCIALKVDRPVANGGPFMLDKYLITAGRMRAFLEAINYDVKGYIHANLPAWWPGTTWDANMPSSKDEFLSMSTTGGSGCYIGAAANQRGAPAFWASAADLARVVGGAPRTYSQDELDTKVMNCFRAPIFHALCAFDGGRLPSRDEWIAARTVGGVVRPYPWGSNGSDADRRARASYDFDYSWPRQPGNADNDFGGYLPAPGRFPLGAGPFGHADLLGSLENMGSQSAAGGKVSADGWIQFSFQEVEQSYHPYGQQIPTFGSTYGPHWAVGARCVKLP